MGTDEREEDFAALLAEQDASDAARRQVRAGERVEARVVTTGPVTTFLDIGAKAEAVIDTAELRDPETQELTVAVGDTIEVTVSDDGRETGSIVCRRVGRGGQTADELADAFALGLPVEGVVSGQKKGGFEVQIGSLRAFCPGSQIDLRHGDPAQYVGQRLQFKVTKLEQGGRNIVVGRRAMLEAESAQRREETLARLEVGAVVTGRVSSLRDFGAFVDLGGIEGLIHVSELGWDRGAKVDAVLEPGQEVTAQVVKRETDPKTGAPRIGLSMRALAPDPWTEAVERFPPGTTVRGRVRKVESFGAFVELAPGVDGLVHVSRLAVGRRVSHPRQVVDEGQEVEVTVVTIDPAQKRIGLSMIEEAKRVAEAAEQDQRRDTEAAMARSREQSRFGTLGDLLAASRQKRR